MVRWKNRTPEDKQRIACEAAGYPLADKLEEKLKSMKKTGIPTLDSKQATEYILKWVEFHWKNKTYTVEQLRPIVEQIYSAQRTDAIFSIPYFQDKKARDDFIMQTISMISTDSPFPEEWKKQARAAMQEIMGTDATFDKDALPSDYVPSFKRKADEFFAGKKEE